MPKQEHCVQARNGGVACGCCGGEVKVEGLKPFNRELLDRTMDQLEKAGRVKQCVGCNHMVIVCEDDADESVAFCACCLDEAGKYENYGDDEF